jgi:hypothetical protein
MARVLYGLVAALASWYGALAHSAAAQQFSLQVVAPAMVVVSTDNFKTSCSPTVYNVAASDAAMTVPAAPVDFAAIAPGMLDVKVLMHNQLVQRT